MKSVTFASMLLLQRVDEAARLEQSRPRPDFLKLWRLYRQRSRLTQRLRAPLADLAWG